MTVDGRPIRMAICSGTIGQDMELVLHSLRANRWKYWSEVYVKSPSGECRITRDMNAFGP